jgi:hypothetical protein
MSLDQKTVCQLKELAKTRNIKGFSTLRKPELIKLLKGSRSRSKSRSKSKSKSRSRSRSRSRSGGSNAITTFTNKTHWQNKTLNQLRNEAAILKMKYTQTVLKTDLVGLLVMYHQMVRAGIPDSMRAEIMNSIDFLYFLKFKGADEDDYYYEDEDLVELGDETIPRKVVDAISKVLLQKIKTGEPRQLETLYCKLGDAITGNIHGMTTNAKELYKDTILYDLLKYSKKC